MARLAESERLIWHWKARAEAAEADRDRLRDELEDNQRWEAHYRDKYRNAARRVAELEAALRETLNLAAVAHEGDPWYAEDAEIDAEAVFTRARAALAGDGGGA